MWDASRHPQILGTRVNDCGSCTGPRVHGGRRCHDFAPPARRGRGHSLCFSLSTKCLDTLYLYWLPPWSSCSRSPVAATMHATVCVKPNAVHVGADMDRAASGADPYAAHRHRHHRTHHRRRTIRAPMARSSFATTAGASRATAEQLSFRLARGRHAMSSARREANSARSGHVACGMENTDFRWGVWRVARAVRMHRCERP